MWEYGLPKQIASMLSLGDALKLARRFFLVLVGVDAALSVMLLQALKEIEETSFEYPSGSSSCAISSCSSRDSGSFGFTHGVHIDFLLSSRANAFNHSSACLGPASQRSPESVNLKMRFSVRTSLE